MKNESKSKYLQPIAINLLHRFNGCFFVEFFVIPFMVMPIKIFTHDNIFHHCNTGSTSIYTSLSGIYSDHRS